MPRQKLSNQGGSGHIHDFMQLGAAFIIGVILLTAITIANYRFVSQSPGGSDFIPRWIGTRLLLTEGENPYGERATAAIQEMMYGRKAKPGEDQVLFVYPLYSIVLFVPFALVEDFTLVRALWITTLQVALILTTIISLRLANWRPTKPLLTFLLIFSLIWYHAARPLINGNAAILVALFIATGLLAIETKHDVIAGMMLSLSTIKPQMVVLLIPFIMIWSVSQKRWTLLASFFASIAGLLILATLLVPSWINDNLAQVIAYPSYTLPGTPSAIFSEWWPSAGRVLGWILTVGMIFILIWRWRSALRPTSKVFLLVACLTLAITNLIGIRTTAANFIALTPAFILILANIEYRYKKPGRILVWLLLIVTLVSLWALFLVTRSGRMQNPVLFFPLPVFAILSLLLIPFELDGNR